MITLFKKMQSKQIGLNCTVFWQDIFVNVAVRIQLSFLLCRSTITPTSIQL